MPSAGVGEHRGALAGARAIIDRLARLLPTTTAWKNRRKRSRCPVFCIKRSSGGGNIRSIVLNLAPITIGAG